MICYITITGDNSRIGYSDAPKYENVYNYIYDYLDKNNHSLTSEEIHNKAAEASSWCEMASVGEVYDEGDGYIIECEEADF